MMTPDERPSASLSGTMRVFFLELALESIVRDSELDLGQTLSCVPFLDEYSCFFYRICRCRPNDVTGAISTRFHVAIVRHNWSGLLRFLGGTRSDEAVTSFHEA